MLASRAGCLTGKEEVFILLGCHLKNQPRPQIYYIVLCCIILYYKHTHTHIHIYIYCTPRLLGECRKLHNEELNDRYSSPSIVWAIKSRRMRWAGLAARMGRGDVYTGFW